MEHNCSTGTASTQTANYQGYTWGTCPRCGWCPTCGRPYFTPYTAPYCPAYPVWVGTPGWTVTTTSNPITDTNTGGNS